jgi:hypothetical protein
MNCDYCNFEQDGLTWHSGVAMDLCDDCIADVRTCDFCGNSVLPEDVHEFGNDTIACWRCWRKADYCTWCDCPSTELNNGVCQSCEDETIICRGCDDRVNIEYSYEHEGRYYCESCYDDINKSDYIYDYHCHGIVPRRLCDGRGIGTELELEFVDSPMWVAEVTYSGENTEYFEWDGSVEGGFETVTHIMDIEQHRRWIASGVGSSLLEYANASQCVDTGLHVNVDMSYEVRHEVEGMTKLAIYMFVNYNADDFKRLGRRWSDYYADYEYVHPSMGYPCTGKSSAIYLRKDGCIEFRLFHTATNDFDYMGSVQVAHATVEFVSDMVRTYGYDIAMWMLLEHRTFGDFVKFAIENYDLKEYMAVYLTHDCVKRGECLCA